jgi:hypothetical protein
LKKTKELDQVRWLLRFAFLAALSLSLGCVGSDLKFSTEYQAVFLDNGQVFFGKLSDTGSSFLTLRDIYYVQTVVEREKKETTNILVKRGSEWHNPDFMLINTRHVLVIEPVGPNSRVAQLIREAQAAPVTQKAPEPKSESKVPASAPTPSGPKTTPQEEKR